jgi:hypothetical protein
MPDLFHADRPQEPEPTILPPAAAASIPGAPVAALVGVIGGPPWQALFDHLPGVSGVRVLVEGDSIGGIRIMTVTRDYVVIIEGDSTRHLVLKRAYQ